MKNRAQFIKDNWNNLLERAENAAISSGRKLEDITIIGVSKKMPLDDIKIAHECGCRIFGENYVQELEEKWPELKLTEWSIPQHSNTAQVHFIGSLQRNKVKKAIKFCSMIQSLDSIKLAKEINKEVEKSFNDFIYPVIIQVNVSSEEQKGGVSPSELDALSECVLSMPRLKLSGLMTIGSEEADDSVRIAEFRILYELKEKLEKKLGIKKLPYLSMGMSGDFELAIKEGSNMIRIGSTIFGSRS